MKKYSIMFRRQHEPSSWVKVNSRKACVADEMCYQKADLQGRSDDDVTMVAELTDRKLHGSKILRSSSPVREKL